MVAAFIFSLWDAVAFYGLSSRYWASGIDYFFPPSGFANEQASKACQG